MKSYKKITVELTKDEVMKAIKMYLTSTGSEIKKIDDINSITERREIPGFDPHDCDYVEEFSGIEVTGS